MTTEIPQNTNSHTASRYVIQRITICLIFALFLFVSAGTIEWLRGWIYFLYGLSIEICALIIYAIKAPEMLEQRGASHKGVKTYDKVFLVVWLLLVLITSIVAGFDAIRYHWSSLPFYTVYLGAILIALAYVFGTWAMVENEHFEQFVRIQTDRKHHVVTTGPYRIVRHPGYAATIVGALGVPLMLGSLWTFIPTGAAIILFVIRTSLEDRTLSKELDGYVAYTKQTRYRLIPGIW
jgi:protein-S-isoprenylcysteine O-methyltransferase Ste14